MIEVNGYILMDEIEDILQVLRSQLLENGFKRFDKIIISGDNVMTNCPFHKGGQERKPSFGIYKKDGVCHCFGCGWSGSFVEMVSMCFGKNDLGLYGSKWLCRNFLTVQVEERPILELDMSRGKKGVNKKYVSEEELKKYRRYHPYWAKRRITNANIIKLFDLGYDEDADSVTFPIRDIHGNCLFIARRSVRTKYFNYPAGVEKPVYGLYELYNWGKYDVSMNVANIGEVIVCESMIDALTCWQYGRYAVALNGLGNDLQFRQLNAIPCREFILATDMDDAGLRARKRIKERIKNKLVREYVWDLTVAKDINDMTESMFNQLKEVF